MDDSVVPAGENETRRREQLLYLVERLYAQQNRLFLRHHLLVPELERILRWISVQIAMNDPEFAIEGRDAAHRQTYSHAAITTGLSRQEVAEQEARPRALDDALGGHLHRMIRVLAAWRTGAGYQDAAGQPVELPLRGRAPSLEKLCLKYGRQTLARPMADALVKNGNAAWIGESEGNRKGKKLRFLSSVVTAPLGTIEDAVVMTQIGSDFMHSFQQAFKFRKAKQPRFRESYFNDIDAEHADEALTKLYEEIHLFNDRCNRLLNNFRAAPGRKIVRLGVGSYSFFAAPMLFGEEREPE